MKYTFRNIGAMLISIWYILIGSVKKSIGKAMEGEYILSVYFHNPDKKLFTKCIKWLQKKGFHFISMDEFKLILNGDLPFPRGAVLLTVDDGWKSNKSNIIDVVKRYSIPVTIFITVDPVVSGSPFWWSYVKAAIKKGILNVSLSELKDIENSRLREIVNNLREFIVLGREAMTQEQILDALNEGNLTIGSHTISHPILPNCTDNEVVYELQTSKERLESLFKNPVTTFAYPNGSYTQREIKILKDIGYDMAFNTRLMPITPACFLNQFELPRMEVLENVSFWETICRMSGVWREHGKIV